MADDRQRAVRVSLVESMQRKIEETLDPLVGDASSVINLNVPFHTNIGDALIWMGTRSYLERKGIHIEYMASHATANLHALQRCDSRIILLQGGGNFGDLWPGEHILAERVVAACPRHRIILLPQSMYFRNPGRLKQCQEIFARHADLHLCLREEVSYAASRKQFPTASAYLCPDMAWYLGTMDCPSLPEKPLLILTRTDQERKAGPILSCIPADRCDWTGSSIQRNMIAGIDATLCHIGFLRRRAYIANAVRCMSFGRQLLARYQTLVTDRLHAHILALLMGKRHVVLDNSYGKIRATFNTWTHLFEEAKFLDNEGQADSQIVQWLAQEDHAAASRS